MQAVFTRKMKYQRILTIQDISCVGQCSITVALPILSACGLETCILPTALLSTHTGGFGKPAVVHFDASLEEIRRHWQQCGIVFDGILVGYLGSVGAVETAGEILNTMLSPGGISVVDPAMADHGKLYAGFDEAYVCAMKGLCNQAQVILPNITEAALLSGVEYQENWSEAEQEQLLSGFSQDCVVLTGATSGKEETGVLLRQNGQFLRYSHRRISQNFHGTGDIFAACFTGALMQGKDAFAAAKLAADFTCRCIENTVQSPAHWYGVKFEPNLPMLMKLLEEESD